MSRRTTLIQDYETLRESGSTSDFPNILGNVMNRQLIEWFKSVPQQWRKYTAIGDAKDFRPQTRIVGYEAEDLVAVEEDGVYLDSKLADAAYTVVPKTYGRAFSINRQVIINDDLGYIKQQPKRFGRSAARFLSTFVAQTLLEGNGNAFDGNALFSVAHSNLQTGAGTVLSSTNIQTAITAMQNQTVLGVYHSVNPTMLVIPPALQWKARQILNSAIIVAAGGDAGTGIAAQQFGNINVLDGALDIVVDPFLTSTTAWYTMASPNDVPILDVIFLNGQQTPDLLVEKATMMHVAGSGGSGDDPYEYEIDTMRYKVRLDVGGAVSLWWGAQKYAGA